MSATDPRHMGLAVAALALLLGTGCGALLRAAHSGPTLRRPVDTALGRFVLEYPASEDEGAKRVRQALQNASPRLARWGTLQEPVTVRVHPTHRALERAAGRSGYAWLRAWARYDEVDVQTPRSWGPLPATQGEVDELLLHEVTHSLMYQLGSHRLGWRRAGIPVWFREGMASYTAEQGYRWPSLEQLTRYLQENPGHDPLGAPEPLYQERSAVVYAAAHHAFTFLVKRYGEESVRALLARMDGGARFPEAFEATLGLTAETFVRDFERYVRWRGYKGGRLLRRPAPGAPRAE